MNNQSYSAIASAFIYLLTLLSFLFTWQSAHAAAKGDYRSKGIGYTFYWSSPASWEYYTGSAWVAATDYPGQNRKTGTVTIRKSHYCLLDVSPANPIENLVLAAGNTTTTGVGYSTLFGFNAGTPLTLKVAGDVILNKNSFMGVNIYEPEPADVRHRFEIEGNLTGTASPCGVVFYFYNSDVVDLVFTGGDNSTISGLNPFIQSTTGIFSPFTSSSLNRVTVNKSKNKSTLTLG